MKEKDEIKALRQRMSQMAAAGDKEAVAAIADAIADMEAETDDDDYGDEEE